MLKLDTNGPSSFDPIHEPSVCLSTTTTYNNNNAMVVAVNTFMVHDCFNNTYSTTTQSTKVPMDFHPTLLSVGTSEPDTSQVHLRRIHQTPLLNQKSVQAKTHCKQRTRHNGLPTKMVCMPPTLTLFVFAGLSSEA